MTEEQEVPRAAVASREVSRGRVAVGVLSTVLAVSAFLVGFVPRKRTQQQLQAQAGKRKITPPIVNAVPVKRAAATTSILLPGNITPITEAYIFARAAGYLKRRLVDIGDRVRAGQLLAEIDAPDLDQQVTEAEAALSQAEAQLGQALATQQQLIATRDLATLTWRRYSILQATGAVSRQDGDMQSTAAKTAEANVVAGEKNVRAAENFVHASRATLERLRTLQSYEKVTAPFAGIITSRNVDVGALISTAGSSLGPARSLSSPADLPGNGEMFRVAEIGHLRILVSVPQSVAPFIVVGQPAEVKLQEFPDRVFPGKVTRTSSSLDAGSRTLLTEVQVANADGILLPGMYALVTFTMQRAKPPLLIPDAALVTGADGTRVAVLRPLTAHQQERSRAQGIAPGVLNRARSVHYANVQPGRDFGQELEILNGLHLGDEVVIDPGDDVSEGVVVQLGDAGK